MKKIDHLCKWGFTLAQVNLGNELDSCICWVGFKLFVRGCIFKLVFFGGIGDKNHLKRPFDQFSINYLRYGRQQFWIIFSNHDAIRFWRKYTIAKAFGVDDLAIRPAKIPLQMLRHGQMPSWQMSQITINVLYIKWLTFFIHFNSDVVPWVVTTALPFKSARYLSLL